MALKYFEHLQLGGKGSKIVLLAGCGLKIVLEGACDQLAVAPCRESDGTIEWSEQKRSAGRYSLWLNYIFWMIDVFLNNNIQSSLKLGNIWLAGCLHRENSLEACEMWMAVSSYKVV